MSYKAIVGKLTNVRPHSNADKIKLATVYGSQVVISLENTEGQLGIFFPTDGKLSEEFCKANNLLEIKDENGVKVGGGYLNEKRKIRCQKFRGERSEGLWMPLESLKFTGYNLEKLSEGMQLSELNGIQLCEKYFTPATKGSSGGKNKNKKPLLKKKLYPTFKEHIDTDNIKYYWDKIKKGSLITITCKMHGSSGRSAYVKEEKQLSKIKKLVNSIIPIWKNKYKYVCGSRRVIIGNFESKDGFYGDNLFRKQHHEKFINKLYEGEEIFYEIVGWVSQDKPIMATCSNKELGKDFVKKYGDKTIFKYGCINGTSDIYVYRMTMINEQGYTIEYPWELVKKRCREMGIKYVLEFENCSQFFYDGNVEILKSKLEQYIGGEDLVDNTHTREGIVVRVDYEGKTDWYKWKNFEFLALEGLLKEDDKQIDIEEQQDFIKESPNVPM